MNLCSATASLVRDAFFVHGGEFSYLRYSRTLAATVAAGQETTTPKPETVACVLETPVKDAGELSSTARFRIEFGGVLCEAVIWCPRGHCGDFESTFFSSTLTD